jgi:hypothetical protein
MTGYLREGCMHVCLRVRRHCGWRGRRRRRRLVQETYYVPAGPAPSLLQPTTWLLAVA